MRNLRIILVLVLVVATARLTIVALPASGVMTVLQPRLVERCSSLAIAPGTEDVTFDPVSGVAFVSASDRRGDSRGGIHVFEPHHPGVARLVSVDAPEDFHPHGISLWTGPDGARRLFVVNHRAAGHSVEIFDVAPDHALIHAETVAYPALASPNDVLAAGSRSFYATNDHAYGDGAMGTLEAYFALPLASVSYYDGERGRIVAKRLQYANGINISADGRHVFVAELLGRRVRVYGRNAATGDLRPLRSLSVPTAPDNIEVAADGSLWIGGHPRVFDFLAHRKDASRHAPSHVIRLDPAKGGVETVLVSLDGELNASSVAAVHDGVLVVGAVFDGHVLVCPLGEVAEAGVTRTQH